MYLNLYHQFSSMQLKIDDFNSQIETAKGEFISRFTDTELPWDLDESFENMCAACKLTRHKASENWYNQISERLSSLESMSSQEADELLRAISTRPAYVDDKEYGHKLTKLQIRIEKYLESKGVEWLIEKFKQLSPGAKKIFLAQIAK